MAFSDLGNLGAGGTTTANQSSLTVATVSAINADDFVVVAVTVDNRVSGGGDDLSVSGVTVDGTALTKARQNATNLAAQAGASVSLWFGKPGAKASGVNIVASFTTNTTSDAQALSSRRFGVAAGSTVSKDGDNATTSTTATPGSLDVTTANAERLRIRAIGCEFDATQTLTQTTNWTPWTEAASAATGTIAEQVIEVEHRIVTATTSASNPSLGSACDNASVYAAFAETLADQLMGQAVL
jgi:hypothetical protein